MENPTKNDAAGDKGLEQHRKKNCLAVSNLNLLKNSLV